jgi:hypothetical protein
MRQVRFLAGLSFLLSLTMLLSMPAKAQFKSSIEGSVTDASGAVVPEAQVTLTNVDTGVTRTVPTNEEGLYRFPALAPGHYRLTATKKGFAKTSEENIVLLAEEVRTVPLALKAGEVTETVTVTAETTPIQLSESKVGSDISARELSQLPLAGGNLANLIQSRIYQSN